jgi:hypothetical protein
MDSLVRRIKRRLSSIGTTSNSGNVSIDGNRTTVANGKVTLQDSFLSPNDFIKVQNWGLSVPCELNREDRKWSMSIVRNFAECYSSRQWSSEEDDMPPEARLFVNAVYESKLVEPDAVIVVGILRWQQKSGMGEHTDGHTNTAITFYLNDTWKDNWYGDLIFYESMEDYKRGFGRSVTPVANRLVINRDTVMHKVTYCSELAVERISIQGFVLKK